MEKLTKWKHFTIAESLPGHAWGTGGIGLGDLNGNGNLEVAVSRRETQTAYWFERKNDATWIRHIIGKSKHLEKALGAAVLDIDQDGWPDIAFSYVRTVGQTSLSAMSGLKTRAIWPKTRTPPGKRIRTMVVATILWLQISMATAKPISSPTMGMSSHGLTPRTT
jgi:hypothetical protein